MPRIIISIDGVVIKEVPLTQPRTTLGRRPYNDIVIDNLAVSGEHAAIHLAGQNNAEIEDLGSTNGTYVNARAVKRQGLRDGDTVEIARYRIRFLEQTGEISASAEKTGPAQHDVDPSAAALEMTRPVPLMGTGTGAPAAAVICVISGAAAGRELSLHKVVTTIGTPGVAVASITKRPHGYVLAHLEGQDMPQLNGQFIGAAPVPIKDGDQLELAGALMQFKQG